MTRIYVFVLIEFTNLHKTNTGISIHTVDLRKMINLGSRYEPYYT